MAVGTFPHRRRSIRLPHYNYGTGSYFITLCVQDRKCLFGAIVDGAMRLDALGSIVAGEWQRTAEIRPAVALDEFVVMPNHFHAIVAMEPSSRGVLHTPSEKFHSPSQALGAVVRGFKSSTARSINEMRGTPGVAVWQRNYYEHVIRNDEELQRIREYIANNPAQWTLDRENPQRGVYRYAPTDRIESIFGGERP